MSVYYYRVNVSRLTDTKLAGVELAPLFDAITGDGLTLQRFTILDWRACAAGPLPQQIDEPSTEVALCFAAAVPDGGLVPAGVRFSQAGGPYDALSQTGVTWAN